MKTFNKMSDCPFQVHDRVRDNVSNREGVVTRVEDENVFVTSDDGVNYYRTWTHDLDTVMKKGGGGLTRIGRPE